MTESTNPVNIISGIAEEKRKMAKRIVSNCIKTFLYPTVSNAQNPPTPVVCCERNRLDRTFRKPVSLVGT